MSLTRREFVAAAVTSATARTAGAETPRAGLGILLYSFGIRSRRERGFADPLAFASLAHDHGAAGIQLPLGIPDTTTAKSIRGRCGELGLALEGIVRPPADEQDVPRFEREVRSAAACGAEVIRTVLSAGRRYETFTHAADFPRFTAKAEAMLRLAHPVARAHRVRLAVENHKDFRVGELAELMRKHGSEYVGVCLDTGNNIALLDDPYTTIRELAPWAFTVHLKDMGVEESSDGFRLAEVPLGSGRLNVPAIVAEVRKTSPRARFHLEMITRDPLSIPCLSEKYWATLDHVPGRELARMLAWVRAHPRPQPLPVISKLSLAEQVAAEERHVRESFAYAARVNLLGAV